MDKTRLWLMIWSTAWLLTWAGSFLAFWLVEPAGDGFVRGLNRVTTFLGWQGIAAMFSIPVYRVSRGWPKGSAPRRIGLVPIIAAGVLLLAILTLIAWARFTG